MYESSSIKYYIYGFDIFHFTRICNKYEERKSLSEKWNILKKKAFNDALLQLINYYNIENKFDLYPKLVKDIVERYKIPWEYEGINFNNEQINNSRKYKKILKTLEHNMILYDEIPTRWKSEQEMFRIIKKKYPDSIFHFTDPQWLSRQHLDVYVPSINCAFEYQGKQHFKGIEYFGGEKEFKKREILDNRKCILCNKKGVHLIEWNYSEPLTRLVLMNKIVNIGLKFHS